MKRFRVMAAALCAVVLLCGFSVPAYAYADGGEGADYGDPINYLGQETYGKDNAFYSRAYSKIDLATDEDLIAQYKEFTALVDAA